MSPAQQMHSAYFLNVLMVLELTQGVD